MAPPLPFRTKRALRYAAWALGVLLAVLAWAKWGPMEPLFRTPRSTVLLDRDGQLLGATVAPDGQWRMPSSGDVPPRFERCLLEFEDRRFRHHWGVHLPSLVRAWRQNRAVGRTVSGGSTLTMQLARMSGGPTERTMGRKLMEMLLALRIELRHDKDDILATYAANAPFGGNVVGLDAAAWRWFGREPNELGWAECAVLAVLPNAPARVHPGRNRAALKAKRDRLLGRLLAVGAIDSLEWSLAVEEPLPDAPHALPRRAPHLLTTLMRQGNKWRRTRTTIDGALQDRVMDAAQRYADLLRANEVHNAAVLVLDTRTGEALVYVGNLPSAGMDHAGAVDITRARRSTGSLLKPFLYADMLRNGELMPDQLVADLPTRYEGFAPRNFDQRYDGAVPASRALARSLNVPAVRALREHGVERTRRTLRAMGLHQVDRPAGHYGLSLIVGGAESSLWELTGAYATMARILLRYGGGTFTSEVVHPPRVLADGSLPQPSQQPAPLSPAAVYHTLVALQQVNRPETEAGWHRFAGAERIAWKTGTSPGHRDAWAIGVTDRHTVGVWTGNASGEGRPGLTGGLAAAPLLFEVFAMLPRSYGFDPPYDDMERMAVCRESGHRASMDCVPVDTAWTIARAARTPPCPYHHRILVNASGDRRTRPGPDARSIPWFTLPPAMEHYYAASHPGYRAPPPWDGDGDDGYEGAVMEPIYPERGSRVLVPVLLDGSHGLVVLEAAHREADARIHWDLDGGHLGTTTRDHRLAADLPDGPHRLTLTDQRGRTLSNTFRVERGKAPER